MKAKIAHYHGVRPPVPQAVDTGGTWEVEYTSIEEFARDHGNIILSPPGQMPFPGDWFIYVTDSSGRFNQK